MLPGDADVFPVVAWREATSGNTSVSAGYPEWRFLKTSASTFVGLSSTSEPGRKRRLWNTVEPPCATTSHKRPPIQNTKVFPVKALQLEPLVNDHLLSPVSDLACVASISVWFRSKEIPRKGTFGIPRSFRLNRTETLATQSISDRDHFMGLTINDFPLFLTSCKRPLDSVFDLCFRCLHYVT